MNFFPLRTVWDVCFYLIKSIFWLPLASPGFPRPPPACPGRTRAEASRASPNRARPDKAEPGGDGRRRAEPHRALATTSRGKLRRAWSEPSQAQAEPEPNCLVFPLRLFRPFSKVLITSINQILPTGRHMLRLTPHVCGCHAKHEHRTATQAFRHSPASISRSISCSSFWPRPRGIPQTSEA